MRCAVYGLEHHVRQATPALNARLCAKVARRTTSAGRLHSAIASALASRPAMAAVPPRGSSVSICGGELRWLIGPATVVVLGHEVRDLAFTLVGNQPSGLGFHKRDGRRRVGERERNGLG